MAKSRGTPLYTQSSVAWPHSHPSDYGVVDEIIVDFSARGGGCYGSGVSFKFHQFSSLGRPSYGVEITGWTDGMESLLDERIQSVLKQLGALSKRIERRLGSDAAPTPEQVIDLLERSGVRPSGYHLRGQGVHDVDMPAYVRKTDSL